MFIKVIIPQTEIESCQECPHLKHGAQWYDDETCKLFPTCCHPNIINADLEEKYNRPVTPDWCPFKQK